jgi:ammonium transporter, Amt family
LPVEAPSWLNPGDTAWQMTAATLVGLMSVPGLAVLYGGVMQKRWSINSMMLTFATFATVLIVWVLWGFKMGFGSPFHGLSHSATGFFGNFIGKPGAVLSHTELQHQANIPLVGSMAFPNSALVYFQLVFAAITPILALGSVLGRVNFKAWIPFCLLWITCVYCVDAFLIWGGGFFAHHGAVDYSGGYVIHLSAGVAGFVAAAVIGPRLQRDREIDAPNNVAMVAVGAGLLWLGWNGFNGGDPYAANMSASAAILNTNLCTAVAFLIWVGWDYLTGRKPSLLGGVNGCITGLVAITPAAGYVNGWGAIAMGIIASTLVYFALNYLSRLRPFRLVDDTLGVVYTHGFAGLAGGLLVGIFADPNMALFYKTGGGHGLTAGGSVAGLIHGNATLLKWQFLAALFVICWTALVTFALLKLVGVFIPLRMSEKNMEIGDVAEHGHEVYPSDVPSLGYPGGIPGHAGDRGTVPEPSRA